jgi:alpha-mannosidase
MLVVDAQGNPVRGLTNGSSVYDYSLGTPGKRILPVTEKANGGEIIDVWTDAGCNDLFGNLSNNGEVKEAYIAVVHEEVRALFYDFEVLLDFLKALPPDSPRAHQINMALNDATWQLAHGNNDAEIKAARTRLAPALAKRGGDPMINISAIGHAHIDLGWLWPIRETKRKGARTFATVLENMRHYPDYIFGASQPQLFQWVKDDYPQLYEQVKQRVQEGRFEPQGAMWVEADTNVSGGEALTRQLLLGKRFFRKEFGIDINYMWLPDVFGYSGALPQILKKAGVEYFMTQKMSWNQVNTFPHHSFYWQGIDGSSVLAHMLPEETYNSPALPRSVVKIENNYHDKGVSEHAMILFGIGDGGGGPGEEHLERLKRIRNLAGLSPVRQEPASRFFEQWVKEAERFPTWVGELYLERHAGTLTTEARNKWYNRRIEQALRQLEWIAVFAGIEYPAARLETIWREVLLYQFHDILPGSSIKRVYDESLARYREMFNEVEELTSRAEEHLAHTVDTNGMGSPAVIFNSLSWTRNEWMQVHGHWKRVTAPPLGYQLVDASKPEAYDSPIAEGRLLENDILRVSFDEGGAISSIYFKPLAREIVPPGQRANLLAVYLDPGDAWDFPLDYAKQTPQYMRLVSSKSRIDGPRAVFVQTYKIGSSEVVQEIVLTAGSSRLDFHTRVRWRERQAMLRTTFPVAVHAEEAAFEIQFGHIRRPTHRNTTWDLAKDEVAAHKWVDLSQHDFGVALLNDSKYGHKVKGNVIDLDLLRSVPYPGYNTEIKSVVPDGDPHPGYTDQADHVFSYALFPHPGDLVEGQVVRAGYEFNIPLRQVNIQNASGSRHAQASLLTVEPANVIVEAVKQAEDDEAIVVRLYESAHSSANARIQFGFPVASVEETNLIEQPLQRLPASENGIILKFEPFEIKTLKVKKKI